MNQEEKISLITRNAEEILNKEEIEKTLKKKNLKVYCGYEPSGPIHIGTLVTVMKLLDFQRAGISSIVLLANWHAWLNKKGDWQFLERQMKTWQAGIKASGLVKAKFIKGTDFQQKKDFSDGRAVPQGPRSLPGGQPSRLLRFPSLVGQSRGFRPEILFGVPLRPQ